MAGLTDEGLEIKRLGEVVNTLKEEAVPIFQDLVIPGDVVDTSDSSTIGRLIGLVSPSLSDLWEALQELYWSFDPNSARGIALDNLVMYGGLTRRPASATTATVVLWGDEGTFIPATVSQVRSVDNTFYNLTLSASLDRAECIGFKISVPTVTTGVVYSISIQIGIVNMVATHTAIAGNTPADVIDGLHTDLLTYPSIITVSKGGNNLTVEGIDIFDNMDVTVSNVVVDKIKARSEVINQEVGVKEQESNTITTIATPLLGWDSVTNPTAAVSGRNLESDEELRIRFRDSKFLRAQNISDSLFSALMAITGVADTKIYENITGTYDPVLDLPGHSFKVIILGGNPNDIANAIWNNQPLGIGSEGSISIPVIDSQGFTQTIKFDRPVSRDVYFTIDITTNGVFPPNGIEDIKGALIEYIKDNLKIGDDVIYSRLYTPINSVPGHQVNSLLIGTTPAPSSTSNIAIDYDEIIELDESNIVITVT